MKFIRDIYAAKSAARQPVISLEFFPPKTDEGDRSLFEKQIPACFPGRDENHGRGECNDKRVPPLPNPPPF